MLILIESTSWAILPGEMVLTSWLLAWLIAWQPPPLSWFGALLDKSNDRARSVTALLFALAPSGEWVGTYQPLPRAVRVALRAAGLA